MDDDTDVAELPAPDDGVRDRAEPAGGGGDQPVAILVGTRRGRWVRTSTDQWAQLEP